jgi:hypothetical protein
MRHFTCYHLLLSYVRFHLPQRCCLICCVNWNCSKMSVFIIVAVWLSCTWSCFYVYFFFSLTVFIVFICVIPFQYEDLSSDQVGRNVTRTRQWIPPLTSPLLQFPNGNSIIFILVPLDYGPIMLLLCHFMFSFKDLKLMSALNCFHLRCSSV